MERKLYRRGGCGVFGFCIPVLIWTMAAAMCTGIDLLHEVREEHEEKQIEDMWAVDSFYQYQTLKEVKK